ncbi:hypothetical protein J6W91_01960 [Candidatus Saccharibacteria bacterium]|nr:hypothetical protein [Candidatus Saccharibacteria bacterium]
MENKEQTGIAPEFQQAETVSYANEVDESHIDMNPLHGAEAEAAEKVKEAAKSSTLVEPERYKVIGDGPEKQIVEPLTKSSVVVEQKPEPEVPENGFPAGYGPNEHMKKLEKPKKPSLRERMKHSRKKMSKKKKILLITIPSASVLLIGGFIVYAMVTGMFKVDYSGTYMAAKELRNEIQKLRTDTNCDKVIEYVNMQYTAMETYSNYVEGCKTASEGVSDATVRKVGDTNGVNKDEEVRRRYETLKTALAAAKEGNADVNSLLEIYKTWHEWILAEAEGNNKHQEWDWTDADLKKASDILKNSDIEEFKSYGEKWYKLKKAAAEATNAYFHHALNTADDLQMLSQTMSQKQDEFTKWKKENEPDVTELYPLELVDTAKLYAKFEEFYNYIRETYQANYNKQAGGCKEYVTSVVCE